VYVFIITQALNNGGEVPIRDFTPSAKYAANFWVLLIDADADKLIYFKNLSLLLTVAVQLLLAGFFVYFTRNLFFQNKNHPSQTSADKLSAAPHWHPIILLIIPLAFFFGTFYQHMPEYLLMLWPAAALLCTSVWQHFLFAGALTFAWTPRITHGLTTVVNNYGTAAEARSDIVGPLLQFFQFDYNLLNQMALVMQSLVYMVLVIWLCVLATKLQRQARTASD